MSEETHGIEAVEEALDIIDRRGWNSGNLGYKEGAVCIVGALSEACYGDPRALTEGTKSYQKLNKDLDPTVSKALVEAANEVSESELIGVRVETPSELYRLNDSSGVNAEVVKSVLRKAIERIKPARIGAWLVRV